MTSLHASLGHLGHRRQADARQVLLHAGDVSHDLCLIERGCARLYVMDADGKETSTQFFFEGEVVSSLESFLTGRPSALYLATIEPCQLIVVAGQALKAQVTLDAALGLQFQALLQERLIHYANLYTSSIADSPTQRYLALHETHQHLLDRIPLHILAAYLGVSPVHLSRIRRKLKELPGPQELNICS